MKERKPSETDADYIKRLETANAGLRRNNAELTKWSKAVARAVTWLSYDASLAFQAMAEKAGVREHPSVTKVVAAFDTIAHPQWTPDNAEIGDLTFPTDWDLDGPGAWAGDADMELNAGIKMALDYFEGRKFQCRADEWEHICTIMEAIERPLQGVVEKVLPARADRKPIEVPEDADRDQLAAAFNEVSWRALDLAQDMASTNEMLRRDLRAAAYRAVCRDLYELSQLHVPERNPKFDVKVFGDVAPF